MAIFIPVVYWLLLLIIFFFLLYFTVFFLILCFAVSLESPFEMTFEDVAGITLFSYIDNPNLHLGILIFQPGEVKRRQMASSQSMVIFVNFLLNIFFIYVLQTFVIMVGRAKFQTDSISFDGAENDAVSIRKGQPYSITNLDKKAILKLFFCKVDRVFGG